MKLRNLIELPIRIDEDIHGLYSKVVESWEDKGRSRYDLSLPLDILAVITYAVGGTFTSVGSINRFLVVCGIAPFSSSTPLSLLGKIEGRHPTGTKENDGKLIVDNKFAYFLNNLGKTMRTPELVAGVSFMGKGLFDIYNYFMNNDASALSEGVGNLFIGTSLASNASAWFIRDIDPEVTEKKPNWEAGLEKLVEGLKHKPQTSPVPVKY